jgi:hypothetical protein
MQLSGLNSKLIPNFSRRMFKPVLIDNFVDLLQQCSRLSAISFKALEVVVFAIDLGIFVEGVAFKYTLIATPAPIAEPQHP